MADRDMSAEVRGLEETQREMEDAARRIAGRARVRWVRDAALLVQGEAKKNSPVDTGRLRASITPAIRVEGRNVLGVVGSNVEYAPRMEQPGPVRRTGRRPFLRPALEENRDKIVRIIENNMRQDLGL